MTLHRDILKRAMALLPTGRTPKIAYLRRAVSDSYYAVFHALAQMCADTLIGSTKRDSAPWRRIYRGLEHARLVDVLRRKETGDLHPSLNQISSAVVQLQSDRHSADYDPAFPLRRRQDAEAIILLASETCRIIETLPAPIRQELSAILIARGRPDKRP